MSEPVVPGGATRKDAPTKSGQLLQFPGEHLPLHARTRFKKYWPIVLLLLLLGVAGASWGILGQSNTLHYTTAAVTRGSITRSVTATGTVNPELTIIIGTYVSGVIQELFCDYNTVVKKGQICAKIDQSQRPH
jgi:multidrug efflux pump subunit AcrA (membrane-fusion protein)